LRYLIKPYWIARRANRLAGLGLSIGPLHTLAGRLITRRIVRRMHPLLVRDAYSRAFAADCGVTAAYGSDIALAGRLHCPPAIDRRNLRLALALLPAGALLRADPDADRAWTSIVSRALLDVSRLDADMVWVRAPFQRGVDEPCIRAALAGIPAERQADARLGEGPEIALDALNQCSHVIAMRLHALVFATLLRKPALIISYHPKVRRLAEELGYRESAILDLEQLRDARLLAGALADLVRSPAAFMPLRSVDEVSRHVCAELDACIETVLTQG
jgi:polysaccharide pyruvyl transferase WcaK-like protein